VEDFKSIPGFLFFDHIAIAVKLGELDQHVKAYKSLGFTELHREDVLGTDQVREVLLKVGDGPNLIQLLEPLTPEAPVRGGFAHVAFRVTRYSEGLRLHAGAWVQDHRRETAQWFARHKGVFRSPQNHGASLFQLSDGGCRGGQLTCLTIWELKFFI